MPIRAALSQFKSKLCRVQMHYRCQCVDTVGICRLVRDDLELGPEDPEYLRIESLACAALACAVSKSDELNTQSAFKEFRSAVDELREKVKDLNKLEKAVQNAEARAVRDINAPQKLQQVHDDAQRRADEAAAAREVAAREAAATTQPSSQETSMVKAGRHLVEFAVAPSLESLGSQDWVLPDVALLDKSVTRFSFCVASVTTIPELVFRFQRKYRSEGLEKHHISLQTIKWPNFYSEPAILGLTTKNAQPLRNDDLRRVIANKTAIWVYGDRPNGHYQLERPCTGTMSPSLGRVRGVSVAPPRIANDPLIWVFRDLQGQLTLRDSVFRLDFSPGPFDRMLEGQRIFLNKDGRLCIGPIPKPDPAPSVSDTSPGTYCGSSGHPYPFPHASTSAITMPHPQHSTEVIGTAPSLPPAHASEFPTLPLIVTPTRLPQLDLPGSRLSGLTTLFSPSPVQVELERAAPSFPEPSPAPALFPDPALAFSQSSFEVPPRAQPTITAMPTQRPALPLHADPGSTPAVRSLPLLSRGQSLPNLPINPPLCSNIAPSSGTAMVVPSRNTPSPPSSPPPSSASSSTISWIPPLPSLTRVNTAFSDAARTDDSEVMSPRTPAASPRPPPTPQYVETPSLPPPLPTVAVVEPNEQLPLQAPRRFGMWVGRVKSFYASVFNATTQVTEQASGGGRMPGSL